MCDRNELDNPAARPIAAKPNGSHFRGRQEALVEYVNVRLYVSVGILHAEYVGISDAYRCKAPRTIPPSQFSKCQ